MHFNLSSKYSVPIRHDTENEIELVRKLSIESGAFAAVATDHWLEVID